MSELNREQIIKALECCRANEKENTCKYCTDCPASDANFDEDIDDCYDGMLTDAISLIKELTEENEAWQKQLISTEEKSGKAYYELACEVEDLRAENERLRAEKEAATEDLEHCMYFAKPKRPNTCNFCTHDCEVSKDGTRCKGKDDWIYCSPVWRGVVKPKAEGE